MPRDDSAATIALTTLLTVFAASGCGAGDTSSPPHDASTDALRPDDAATQWRDLVSAKRWTNAALQDDPLTDEQPTSLDCDIAAWLVEGGELELDTGRCNYLWLAQPGMAAVEPGDTLRLEVRHFDLTAPEPAQAHLALIFGDRVEWETRVDIPHTAQVLQLEWPATQALHEGQRVGLHLHNHGQNTWTFARLQVRQYSMRRLNE